MSGIGFSELIILFLIGLIILGPERLPRVANQLGSWLGQARRMTRVMKRQLEEELDLEGVSTIKSPYPRSRSEAMAPQSPVDRFDGEPKTAEQQPEQALDDTYSPAHDADAPGTGVNDEPAADIADTGDASAATAEEEPAEVADEQTGVADEHKESAK